MQTPPSPASKISLTDILALWSAKVKNYFVQSEWFSDRF
jgi:hypothetical protein